MKIQRRTFPASFLAAAASVLLISGVGTAIYGKSHGRANGKPGAAQETEASREKRAIHHS